MEDKVIDTAVCKESCVYKETCFLSIYCEVEKGHKPELKLSDSGVIYCPVFKPEYVHCLDLRTASGRQRVKY